MPKAYRSRVYIPPITVSSNLKVGYTTTTPHADSGIAFIIDNEALKPRSFLSLPDLLVNYDN
jgi:hypothetical protein